MKNYIGISLDTSVSMRSIALAAGRDYNGTIEAINEGSTEHNIDTIVNVVNCGVGYDGIVERKVVNSAVNRLVPFKDGEYVVTGNCTPLFKSVDELIKMMESVPDADDPTVSFVLQIITDGGENVYSAAQVKNTVKKMNELVRTDRWTFSFRVPRGYAGELIALGIAPGNILEWDQSDAGVATATAATRSAFRGFYAARASGVKSTEKFYADLSDVNIKEVKKQLVDISGEVLVFKLKSTEGGIQIRDFVEQRTKKPLVKGSAFYQLTKTETVQEYKQIAIRDKKTLSVYSGNAARDMLGLPHSGEVKLAPGTHGQYDVFIQSTSINRKLIENTNVLVWDAVA